MSDPFFAIERIYVKDIVFEAINTPKVFKTEGHTDNNLEMRVNNKPVADDRYEVELSLNIVSKVKEENVYRIKIAYAGIFCLKDFPEEQKTRFLQVECPNRLYPYACGLVSQITTLGTFFPEILQPVDFRYLYQQSQANQKEKKEYNG